MAFRDAFLRLVGPWALFMALLAVALAIRGTGWDGDSLNSIAQFQKLVHPQLYGTPDSGTTPKFLPIAAFGLFHALTGSYAIHWLTMALMAFAVARLVRLPAEHGGGPAWLVLPFLCPLLINMIISADNPALAAAFAVLGVVCLLEGRPNAAVLHFLLSELSRPGSFTLIVALIMLSRVPSLASWVKGLRLSVAIPAVVLGVAHSTLAYRLAYPTLDDLLVETILYPRLFSDPFRFRHDPEVFLAFLRQVWRSAPLVLSSWVLALGAIGWAVSQWTRPVGRNALWALFLAPLPMLPLLAFLVGPFFPNHEYLVFLAIPFLAGTALLANRLLARGPEGVAMALCAIVGLGSAAFDGYSLKGHFETDPPSSVWWTSDPETRRLVEQARERAGRPLVLLASCDLITLMIDVPASLQRMVIFSNEGATSAAHPYLRDCNRLYFRKRAGDILLPADAAVLRTVAPDVVYTTKRGLEWLSGLDLGRFEAHELRAGRVLLVAAGLSEQGS